MKRTCIVCCIFLFATSPSFVGAAQAQSDPQTVASQANGPTQPAQVVPVMNGGAGPCSLQLRITTADGARVYAATVKVHISYGFLGLHRLDLEAGTNADGEVKFTGLPSRVHRPPLTFHARKDQLTGMAAYDPDQECEAKHDIVLEKPKALSTSPRATLRTDGIWPALRGRASAVCRLASESSEQEDVGTKVERPRDTQRINTAGT